MARKNVMSVTDVGSLLVALRRYARNVMHGLKNTYANTRRIQMERLAIEIGVIVVVYLLGYRFGFKTCFDYLKEEIKKEKENENKTI